MEVVFYHKGLLIEVLDEHAVVKGNLSRQVGSEGGERIKGHLVHSYIHVHCTQINLPIVLMIFGALNPTTPYGSSFSTIVTLTVICFPRTPFCPAGPSL